jgi:hypothetical protein
LEIRLHELPVVDYFVPVEVTRTHQNALKPLYYAGNKGRFFGFHDRIVHVVIEENDWPCAKSAWYRNFQRNQILRGLLCCRPNDLIIISDADEIPDPNVIYANRNIMRPVSFAQGLFYYYLNCKRIRKKAR